MKLKYLLPSFLLALPLFADGAEAAGKGSMVQTLMMIGLAFVFFYFILFRPEQKRRKALEKIRSEMKKGDRVTAAGIVGTLAKVQEGTVILKMVDGGRIEVLKQSISEVQPCTEEEAKRADKEETKRAEICPITSDN